MIPWLEDHGEELVIILSPAGQDEVAPRVFFELFGVVIGELQCGMANAVVQAHPCQVVVGVKVVWHCIPHIAGQVDQAVRRSMGTDMVPPKLLTKKQKAHLLPGSPSAWRSTSMSLMKSRIWSGVYKWELTLRTSPT